MGTNEQADGKLNSRSRMIALYNTLHWNLLSGVSCSGGQIDLQASTGSSTPSNPTIISIKIFRMVVMIMTIKTNFQVPMIFVMMYQTFLEIIGGSMKSSLTLALQHFELWALDVFRPQNVECEDRMRRAEADGGTTSDGRWQWCKDNCTGDDTSSLWALNVTLCNLALGQCNLNPKTKKVQYSWGNSSIQGN